MTERETNELKAALAKTLHMVESTVSWAEARGFTNSQEYMEWEDAINRLSVKDHKINFHAYQNMD